MDVATILTSTVVATIVSGLIAAFSSLRVTQRQYLNDYYKTILNRRLVAYERLESLLFDLKTSVIEEDRKPYHVLFSTEGDWQRAYDLIHDVTSQALWLSEEAYATVQELNRLVFHVRPENTSVIEFGKNNYQQIARLRESLEHILATDMASLHNINSFLTQKRSKPSANFIPVKVKD